MYIIKVLRLKCVNCGMIFNYFEYLDIKNWPLSNYLNNCHVSKKKFFLIIFDLKAVIKPKNIKTKYTYIHTYMSEKNIWGINKHLNI